MSATQTRELTTRTETENDDEELAHELADAFGAEEIRRWMSNNGLIRSRGARKIEAARQAVEQDRGLVEDTLAGEFVVVCSNCGYEDRFRTAEAAVDAAREHKSENPTHFPAAYDADGEALYGR